MFRRAFLPLCVVLSSFGLIAGSRSSRPGMTAPITGANTRSRRPPRELKSQWCAITTASQSTTPTSSFIPSRATRIRALSSFFEDQRGRQGHYRRDSCRRHGQPSGHRRRLPDLRRGLQNRQTQYVDGGPPQEAYSAILHIQQLDAQLRRSRTTGSTAESEPIAAPTQVSRISLAPPTLGCPILSASFAGRAGIVSLRQLC